MSNIPKPSVESISRYLEEWDTLEKYTLQESSLGKLFHVHCPENRDIESILLKVSALNDFYSTNIFDTYTVAKHILNLNIDTRLRSGDQALVNEIALVNTGAKKEISTLLHQSTVATTNQKNFQFMTHMSIKCSGTIEK